MYFFLETKYILSSCLDVWVGAQPLPSCSFARQLLGKMVIRCSFACHDQHSPENVVVVLLKGRKNMSYFSGANYLFLGREAISGGKK